MSEAYLCDWCEQLVDANFYLEEGWIQDSDFKVDFCSPLCYERWCEEQEEGAND